MIRKTVIVIKDTVMNLLFFSIGIIGIIIVLSLSFILFSYWFGTYIRESARSDDRNAEKTHMFSNMLNSLNEDNVTKQ